MKRKSHSVTDSITIGLPEDPYTSDTKRTREIKKMLLVLAPLPSELVQLIIIYFGFYFYNDTSLQLYAVIKEKAANIVHINDMIYVLRLPSDSNSYSCSVVRRYTHKWKLDHEYITTIVNAFCMDVIFMPDGQFRMVFLSPLQIILTDMNLVVTHSFFNGLKFINNLLVDRQKKNIIIYSNVDIDVRSVNIWERLEFDFDLNLVNQNDSTILVKQFHGDHSIFSSSMMQKHGLTAPRGPMFGLQISCMSNLKDQILVDPFHDGIDDTDIGDVGIISLCGLGKPCNYIVQFYSYNNNELLFKQIKIAEIDTIESNFTRIRYYNGVIEILGANLIYLYKDFN
jgi:hypothetical protein